MSGKSFLRPVTRRGFLSAAATVAGATVLAACAQQLASPPPKGDEVAPEPTKVAAEPAPKGQVTVVAKAWPGSPFETDSIVAAIAEFEEQHPEIKVDWQTEPQDYAMKVLTQIAGGTPPDTMYAGAFEFFSWVKEGILLDITEQVNSDGELGKPEYWTHYDEELKRATLEGRWYGLGSCWVLAHLYTNLELFERASVEPPSNDRGEAWTWEEFVVTAKALTLDKNGKHPGEAGFDPQNIQQYGAEWPTYWIPRHAAVGSNGADYTAPAPDGRLLLDSPAAMEAIQLIADLVNVHQVAPSAAFFSEIGMNNLEALGSGKVAMICDGSWNLMRIQPLDFRYGTGVLPTIKRCFTNIQAHNQVIAKDAPQRAAAWEFARFLSGDFYQLALCKGGLWLPNHASLATPEGIKSWLNPEVHTPGYEKIAIDYLRSCGETLYMGAGFAEAHARVDNALDDVWVGQAKVADVLPAAVAEANQIIEEWREK